MVKNNKSLRMILVEYLESYYGQILLILVGVIIMTAVFYLTLRATANSTGPVDMMW